MYHMLEVKSLKQLHKQQTADAKGENSILDKRQKTESGSLKRLHTREQSVLKKRIERELKMNGNR